MLNWSKTLCLWLAFLSPVAAYSQALPKLERAKEIATGVLPNGMEYYIASNPAVKGFADFALISIDEASVAPSSEPLSLAELQDQLSSILLPSQQTPLPYPLKPAPAPSESEISGIRLYWEEQARLIAEQEPLSEEELSAAESAASEAGSADFSTKEAAYPFSGSEAGGVRGSGGTGGISGSGGSESRISSSGIRGASPLKPELSRSAKTRATLSELPFFGRRVPYRFLADHGAGYSRNGSISRLNGATIWHLRDIPTYDQNAADSTLLALMNIASQSSSPKAIVIAGDANSSKLKENLRLFSMIVPALEKRGTDSSYRWTPSSAASAGFSLNYSSNVGAIHVNYKAARTSSELMNTIQALVAQSYAGILSELIAMRSSSAFSAQGLELAGSSFRHLSSAQSSDDECYSFALYCAAAQLSKANTAFAQVLSGIDRGEVSAEEFEAARQRLILKLRREASKGSLSNEEYLHKCASAYLLGADLAPKDALLNHLTSRRLPIETELPIFRSFASALLDSRTNLTLRYDVPNTNIDEASLQREFAASWDSASPDASAKQVPAPRLQTSDSRLKLSSESSEPITGGHQWTFANGIRVIYKKLPSPAGQFHYALMLRGGSPEVSGVREGEAGYLPDMLTISNIAGVSGSDFLSYLNSNGISLCSEMSLSDMRVCGMAPREKVALVLQALLALASDRQADKEAFESYRRAETLRCDLESLYPLDAAAVLDSLIRPGFAYSSKKNPRRLQAELSERAEKFFASEFSRVNEGLLVIVGDLDEALLKRELSRSLGHFSTLRKPSAQKTRLSKRYVSSPARKTRKARPGLMADRERGAYIELSAPIIYNNANAYCAQIAAQFLRDAMVGALAEKGAFVDMDYRIEALPSERLSVYLSCRPCFGQGLPLGIDAASPRELMTAALDVVGSMKSISIDGARLQARKDQLLLDYDAALKSPKELIDAVIMRYGGGKDMISGAKAAIASVDAAKVSDMLAALADGARAELVVE